MVLLGRLGRDLSKLVWLGAAWAAFGLGLLGVFVPLLPTTPFILLAAVCFGKSSRRLYVWLCVNPVFGRPLRNYLRGRGLSVKARILAAAGSGVGIGLSIWLAVPARLWPIRAALALGWLALVVHIFLIGRRGRRRKAP